MANFIRKINFTIIFGLIILSGLLTYTWLHTGSLLAMYIKQHWVGYYAAAAIELSVVALSFRIGYLKKIGKNARWPIGVLVGTLVVSAVANISEGYVVAFGQKFTLENLNGIDLLQAFIGVLATGLISIIVFALAEIVGADTKAQEARLVRDDIKNRAENKDTIMVTPTEPNLEAKFAAYLHANPYATYRQIIEDTHLTSTAQVRAAAEKVGMVKERGIWHNGIEVK